MQNCNRSPATVPWQVLYKKEKKNKWLIYFQYEKNRFQFCEMLLREQSSEKPPHTSAQTFSFSFFEKKSLISISRFSVRGFELRIKASNGNPHSGDSVLCCCYRNDNVRATVSLRLRPEAAVVENEIDRKQLHRLSRFLHPEPLPSIRPCCWRRWGFLWARYEYVWGVV